MIIPYVELECPTCKEQGVEAHLSAEAGKEGAFCANGHTFTALPGLEPESQTGTLGPGKEVSAGGESAGGNMETPAPSSVSAGTQMEEPVLAESPSDAPSQGETESPEAGGFVGLPDTGTVTAVGVDLPEDEVQLPPPPLVGVGPSVSEDADFSQPGTKVPYSATPHFHQLYREGEAVKLPNGDVVVVVRIPEPHAQTIQACADACYPQKRSFAEYFQRATQFGLEAGWFQGSGD